jgi:predicted extracellular nuclease
VLTTRRTAGRPLAVGLIAALAFSILPGSAVRPVGAAAAELFFSEYVEGSSNSKALEIFNGTGAPVDLVTGGYNVQMFFNGATDAGLTIDLTGSVADGDVHVLAQSSAAFTVLAVADQTNGAGWFNGDDAVVLRKGTTVIDAIGQVGVDPGTAWGAGLTTTQDHTLRRKPAILAGDTNPSDAFDPSIEWDGFALNTFDGLGSHLGGAVSATCGSPLATADGVGATRNVTGTDPDGRVVDLAITNVAPANVEITIGATTPAGAPGQTASALVTVGAASATGTFAVTITATNDDATPQSGSCTLTVTVLPILSIGTVQGGVLDSTNGLAHRSSFAPASGNGSGQTVAVRGVIVEKTLARTSSGGLQRGFFLQEASTAADGNAQTSDGVFVFLGSFSTLIGGYTPQVGDEIVMTGRVIEFFNLTELGTATWLATTRTGVDIEAEVPPFDVDPPADLADANRYWERREGMRAQVPAGSIVQGGRSVFGSTADAEIYLMRGDHPIASRPDVYERRVFRDPHPLDDVPGQLFDNGNGYRFLLGSLGIKATESDSLALLAPARTFDTLTNSPVGGVYFSFNKYQIQVEAQPAFAPGADPSLNGAPVAADPEIAWTSATYNVENLYDFRDDPTDGCDFIGNSGCPGVSPPFDFVPASLADYQAHLTILASQIVGDLHAPDLIMVQEAEDQDICSLVAAALMCGGAAEGDGNPDTLQELSLRIAALGGPTYSAVSDRDGADDRGIVSGFLFRDDRIELLPAAAADPVLGSDPAVVYRDDPLPYNADVQNPKALNADLPEDVDTSTGVDGANVFTRPPQVGHFRVWRDGIGTSVFIDVWALSNHFSSTPDARVGQRTEQAAYAAAIIDAVEAGEPGARVVVGGDFNVFPRPDDPFAPGDPRHPSDQLGPLYDQGLTSLWDSLVAEVPAAAYSYVFQGQAQTLDSQFISDPLGATFEQYRVAHINADFAAESDGDGARGASDHDPSAARYGLLVTIDGLEALVEYLDAVGELRGNNTAKILLDRIARIRTFSEAGNESAADSQLQAFIDQVGDLSPRFIDAGVAEGLQEEATALLGT